MKFFTISLTLFLLFSPAISIGQVDWRKGGNSQVPPFAPSILGTNNTWNSPLMIHTNGIQRMLMFNGFNGNNDGRIAIGNDLPVGFTPTGRLHLHQTGGNNFLMFTNNFTGTGGGDGLFLGINNMGNGFLGNFEPDEDILFLTESQERMRIWSTTENGLISMGNSGSFIPQAQLHISPIHTQFPYCKNA